jgi:hypothetical protein
MSDRPWDWSPVGLASDPVPGDPVVVRQGGGDYQGTAQAIRSAAASLAAVEAGGQVSLAVDAVMERKTETMAAMVQAYGRYQTAGEALVAYAVSLAEAQRVADEALTQAVAAVREKASAVASKRVYVGLAAGEEEADSQRRYWSLVEDFQVEIDRAGATVRQAQADIAQAQASRDRAAELAAGRIREVTAGDGLNDSWWDDWGARLTSILDAVSSVAGVLALVVSFIPIIGQALGAVLLVVAAVTAIASAVLKTVAASQGYTSWANAGLSIVFAVLACTGLGALRSGLGGLKAATGAWKAAGGLKGLGGVTGVGKATLTNFTTTMKSLGSTLAKRLKLKGGASQYVQSGAAAGPRPPGFDPCDKWATKVYDEIRETADDVSQIAETVKGVELPSGRVLSADDVAAIKSHLFNQEHPLDLFADLGEPVKFARYDASAPVAEAWLRLTEGCPKASDLLLLDHEYAEMAYYAAHPGAGYSEAHDAANMAANWEYLGLE